MNTTTLNMTTLDGGIIIKRGEGGGGNAGGSLEYLDVSNIEDWVDGYLYWSLTDSAKTTKVVGYNEEENKFWCYRYPSILYNGDPIVAVAVDLQEVIYIYDENEEFYIESTLRDFLIMMGQSYGYDNVEELLDSIPRITKEEFFALPERPKKPLNGAWIQHIDGTLYTGGQWTARGFSNDVANGVAVINEGSGVSLVVAKDELDPMPWSSMPDTLIEGIFTTTDIKEKERVYSGAEDTAIIAAADPNSAAAACANYTFPNGQNGYLMSGGEGNRIYDNEHNIKPLMQLLGKTWPEAFAWSCVQYDASSAYYVRLAGIEDIHAEAKSSNFIVRPVCTLENYTFAE